MSIFALPSIISLPNTLMNPVNGFLWRIFLFINEVFLLLDFSCLYCIALLEYCILEPP